MEAIRCQAGGVVESASDSNESACDPIIECRRHPHASSLTRHLKGLRPVSPFRPRKRMREARVSRPKRRDQGGLNPRRRSRRQKTQHLRVQARPLTFASRSTLQGASPLAHCSAAIRIDSWSTDPPDCPQFAPRRTYGVPVYRAPCSSGTTSAGTGGGGGVPSPKGRPPSDSRPWGVSQLARFGPLGTIRVGLMSVWTL